MIQLKRHDDRSWSQSTPTRQTVRRFKSAMARCGIRRSWPASLRFWNSPRRSSLPGARPTGNLGRSCSSTIPGTTSRLRRIMPILNPTETLERHINQNGVLPGSQKLAQFQQALRLRGTPPLYSQDGQGDEAIVYVKIFDPSGSWTWYLTEWDGAQEAFGLVRGNDCELGYVSLAELASLQE